MEEEDQERKRKVEAGKAKLAQFRQRKGQTDSQNSTKKAKKKKSSSGSKKLEPCEDVPEANLSQSDEAHSQSTSAAATTAEFTIMRTVPHGEIIKHDQTYTIEPESEISTTADDYSSEVIGDNEVLTANNASNLLREEEFAVRETYSEHGTQTRLEVMEDELAGKQQEIEELNRELEEMRSAYGTEGLQQLQEFETAVKQRDDIITQLTANLQQARKEKDDIMREFLELTEQSQNLKIQFQHLQASETIRSTSRSSTAADLLQTKQQLLTYQQMLEEQERQLKRYQKENADYQIHIVGLQAEIKNVQQVQQSELEIAYEKKLSEKDLSVNSLKSALGEEEKKSLQLIERISAADLSVIDLNEQLTLRQREINSLTEELNLSKQKERRCSEEIKQLMGAVEDLQKKHHKDTQSEADIVHRMEVETQRKVEQLQAELDEMYGQQIVQMKQELVKQHTVEVEKLLAQHKAEVDSVSKQAEIRATSAEIESLHTRIGELHSQLQRSDEQRSKMKEEFSQQLEAVSSEKSLLQRQIEDLLQDLSFAREQIHKVKQSLSEKESKLNETNSLLVTIDHLKSELATAKAFTKELETKHEAEVTNYKIKLEMLEREKDAVLDRMAESQEAELEKLRTHFLFSQEEELTKLKEDLTREHWINIENLKDNLDTRYKEQMDRLKEEMGQTIGDMQSERDGLITKQNYLMMEISKLKDLLQSVNEPKSEAMMVRVSELQAELDSLRKEEKENGTIEQEVQVLQLRIELLENEVRDKDALSERLSALEIDNKLLKDENSTLQNALKKHNNADYGKNLPDGTASEYLDLKNEIEILREENKKLHNLEHQLKEEIERQKNTFSFAEKNFEVNYQELQEEYACLLNIKEQVENSKLRQEEEYKVKLDVLNQELAKLKGASAEHNVTVKDGSPKLVKADTLESVEVVEKDTTELMEKLETAQRDRQELSLKLCGLSEQLQWKQDEINQLKEQVKSLCQERDRALSNHQRLEEEVRAKNNYSVQINKEGDFLMSKTDFSSEGKCLANVDKCKENIDPNNYSSSCSPAVTGSQQEDPNVADERKSLVERLQDLTSKLKHESLLLKTLQVERDQLQNHVSSLQQEQADMRLQLEAQRISLNQIHAAHMDLIRENFQREKESELCNLKDEMLRVHEQKLQELQERRPEELHAFQALQTAVVEDCSDCPVIVAGGDIASCRVITELLMKKLSEERDRFHQRFKHALQNPTAERAEERQKAECPQFMPSLPEPLPDARDLHTHLAMVLDKFCEEYKRMTGVYNSLEKAQNLHFDRDEQEPTTPEGLRSNQLALAPNTNDNCDMLIVTPLQADGDEKLKIQFSLQRTQLEEKHSEEIERLRCYFQQQLKESEERYATEIIHLQEQLLNVSKTSLEFREISDKSGVELGSQEADIFRSVCAPASEELKMAEEDAAVKMPSGPIYQQLHTLRQALYARYVEEVNALKKQHEAEVDRLKADLTEKHSLENAALKQEITQLTKAKQEILYESFGELSLYNLSDKEEHLSSHLNHLMEERYQERIEEEIARVIVEMTIGFAKQTELARLAALSSEKAISRECPSQTESEDVTQSDGVCVEEKHYLQSLEVKDAEEMQIMAIENVSAVGGMKSDVLLPSDQCLSAGPDGSSSPEHQDVAEPLSTEKTVVLKEQDYNQMVAMGAESAKLRLLYEERVEDMRQELVKQEQEHQQAMEALRLGHMAQLERQVYDQEQLLGEVHALRAQLAENVSLAGENQATEREKLLLEELEALKQTCLNVSEKREFAVQENGSQTEDEHVKRTDGPEDTWEGGHGNQEDREEGKDAPSGDPTSERNTLKRTNNRLLNLLSEIEKTTSAVEETIGRHVVGLLDKSGRALGTPKVLVWSSESEDRREYGTDDPVSSPAGSGAAGDDARIWSGEDELSLPQPLTEFAGIDINPEDEANVLTIGSRLQTAVEKLLEAINETTNQLEHAKAAQTDLVRESLKRRQETTELLRCQEELQERLNEEAKAREHLALELSRAEGLLDGYTDERVFLEKQMQEKTDLVRHLEQELQSTGNRLQEFELERQQILEERELLSRQKNALKADAAPAELQLLEETEKLLQEKIEVQRQAEKNSGDLQKQVKVLEIELDEQMNRYVEMEQEKNADLEDLRQKNLALEKQLEKTRKFLDEQAVDREHERDVFQQEIQKLEQQLKMPQRCQPLSDQQHNQVETLENHLKEKSDKCSELLLSKEQLQRDVQERNEEIEKLEGRVRELEQALLVSTDSLQRVHDRRTSLVIGVKGEMPLEAQLQVEREAMDRKENEITNLEEQLEQFREELENKNEEVQQLHMQLEIQRKESATRLQGLEHENTMLKEECENIQQAGGSEVKGPHLKPKNFQEALRLKDQEIDQLNEQIGRLQTQLEAATDNKVIEEKNEQIKEYKSHIKCLKSDQERLKKNSEEEIEKLNEVIEKLQDELSRIGQKVSSDFASMTEDEDMGRHLYMTEDLTEETFLRRNTELCETELKLANAACEEPAEKGLTSTKAIGKKETSPENDYGIMELEVDGQDLSRDNQTLPTLQNTEFQLQELQRIIQEKDRQLLHYSTQVRELEEQAQVIKHLNEVIQKLQVELKHREPAVFLPPPRGTQDAESSKHHLETVRGEKTMLSAKVELSDAEVTKTELLKQTHKGTQGEDVSASEAQEKGSESNRAYIENIEEELKQRTAQFLASEALLASVQETMQSSIQSMDSQLQDLQRTLKEKESQLAQHADQATILEKQVQEIEKLNRIIQNLQSDLADVKQKVSMDFIGRIESLQSENEILKKKVETIEEEATQAKTELEKANEEIKTLVAAQSNIRVEVHESRDHGDRPEDIQAKVEKMEESLKDKTAQLLARQALYTSMQESMQSVINNLESQLQELTKVIQVKDNELIQYASQAQLLTERTEEVNHLNGVVQDLLRKLSHGEEMPIKKTESLETFEGNCYSNLASSLGSRDDGGLVQETLIQGSTLALTDQALQSTINHMTSQVQELQKVIAEKDFEILHYSSELERLKEQVKCQSDQHDGMMIAMEDTLREKVAAALVSEAQMKAIQQHTKLMQRADRSSEEESIGTQTCASAPAEGEETGSKLSVLSLRLLQLEKQLADLHEQLEVERENVVVANQQAAEKERRLRELQSITEKRTISVTEQPEKGEPLQSQSRFEQPQSRTVDELEDKLRSVKAEATVTKEELCHYRELAEKLKEQLMVKETRVALLEEDLCTVKKCLTEAEDRLVFYMKRDQEWAEVDKHAADVLDSAEAQGQTASDMTSSSSQTDTASSVNSSNQTSRVHLLDKGIQNELEADQMSSTADQVTEIVEQYKEKINQMLDLHAAEILDMEARHISESDSLRQEHYVAIQALTEECEALKAVIKEMKSGRPVPEPTFPASYQFIDAASSDIECSQGTAALRCVEPAPEGISTDDDVATDFLSYEIKHLLRAVHQEGMQVLSLTESAFAEQNIQSYPADPESLLKERKSFLESIARLKDVIEKMEIENKCEHGENTDFPDRAPDWRGELLCAVQDAFCREQEAFMAAFRTQLDTLGTCDAAMLVKQMQHQLQELGVEQINAMDCIQNADRRSLLLEIQDLRSQLISFRSNAATDLPCRSKSKDDTNKQDQHLQNQECHLQLNSVKAKASELQEQLNSERLLVADLSKKLELTKIELETSLNKQNKHFKELESLRASLKQRTNELDALNDTLATEQKRVRELQWALEKEKNKRDRSQERAKEELEDLKILLKNQKLKSVEISKRLEAEELAAKDLREKIASMEIAHDTELSQERSKASELQVSLELEKARSAELANALEYTRGIKEQMQNHENNSQTAGHSPPENLLKELHSQLDTKHNHIVELTNEMESSKMECLQLKHDIELERKNHASKCLAEQEAAKEARKQIKELESRVEDLQQKLNRAALVQKLQPDETCLKETTLELKTNGRREADGSLAERKELVGNDAGWKTITAPTQSCAQSQTAEEGAHKLRLSAFSDGQVLGESSFTIESIKQRLIQVSTKLKQLATKARQRILFDGADDEDFAWSENSLQDVISHLEQVAALSLQGQSPAFYSGNATNSLTEKLLTQNAELTGYVSRLTEEKNDLRNALLRMEDEASRHRLWGTSGDPSSRSSLDNAPNIDALVVSEREMWNKEKLQLQKSLKQTEAELLKVKAELKNETSQRELGRESENIALKRIYGKYLRSESFRKALVYQKKYLLLLLGGFQECEEATLALIARMGGQPRYTDLERITNHTRAFTRFRSAVRVSIAISRMKFLVHRWQKAAVSSCVIVNRNGFGLTTGSDPRTDSPYFPAGSVHPYGDPRHSSCRSRSDFDSPQSTVNSQHRYHVGSSDLSPCSHLQHYDPDRALTDYITRLEALQKRLGSVQSGSVVNNSTHHGIRR
ncbi:A-kinase anchor protein 9 [Spea bombifrons]|uniref:A-kinase anchor protein 9 n=1 Tax=Spea bombifrons TaxID=233779 RepID=UPI00234AA4D0|nr:A-kinase anchor protein 9 [Spea bombifrons]